MEKARIPVKLHRRVCLVQTEDSLLAEEVIANRKLAQDVVGRLADRVLLIRSGRVKELVDPLGRVAGYVNQTISGADYNTALRVREILQKRIVELFDSYDVLVTAAQPITATALTTNLFTDLSFPDPLGAIGNLCGLPALSVPCGFTDKHLPVGLQFIARAGDDPAALQAGRIFQQSTDWHRKHPDVS